MRQFIRNSITMGTMEKQKEQKEQDFMEFLREKKARDGKLSKIGEYFLSGKGKELGWSIPPENMKYVLK